MIFLFVWIFLPLCPQDKENSFKNKEFSKLSSGYYKQSEASRSGPWNDSLEESAFSPNLNGKAQECGREVFCTRRICSKNEVERTERVLHEPALAEPSAGKPGRTELEGSGPAAPCV